MIKDILLDDFLDLEIKNGDFVVAESKGQHFKLLLTTNKGEWRSAPYVGVGLSKYLNSDSVETALKVEIKKQCEADNANVASISIQNGKILIKGNYE